MFDSSGVTGTYPNYFVDNSDSDYMGQVTTGSTGSVLPFNFTLDYNLQVCHVKLVINMLHVPVTYFLKNNK